MVRSRKETTVSFSMNKLKGIVTAQTRQKTGEVEALLFRAKIAPESNSSAEKELTKNISKDMFKGMEVLGQFNLGFIIAKLDNDLFIIDQHASDEKFNQDPERGRNTTIKSQRLTVPQKLELTAANEAILVDNVEIFQKNGFDFEIDRNVLTEQLSHSVFRRYWWLVLLIGTLSNDDDDSSENVAKKTNLRSFKLNRVDLNPLNMSNAGDFCWNWILKDFIQVKKEEGKFVVVCPRPP